MQFKNAQVYRLPRDWGITADELGKQLARIPFQPCGQMDLGSAGWEPVTSSGELAHSVGAQLLICLRVEQRLLPASVVKQETEKRAADIEKEQGFKPGRKLMRELKESVTAELLPKAFTKTKRIYAWIDRAAGWLVVGASTRSAAEPVIELLHKSLDELPLKLLNTNISPAGAMTSWLSGGEAPAGFTVDQDCTLQALTDEGSKVRYSRHSLDGEDVRDHIAAGKQAASLALTFDDRISFVLTERMELKRLQLLDVVTQGDHGADAKSKEEQFDADFALLTGELGKLLPALMDTLGGEVVTV